MAVNITKLTKYQRVKKIKNLLLTILPHNIEVISLSQEKWEYEVQM